LASSLAFSCCSVTELAKAGPAVQTQIDHAESGLNNNSFANGTKVDIPLTGSRWSRKTDKVQPEKPKAPSDTEAAKKAEAAQKQARQAQIDAYKQIQQMSVDANNQAVLFGKQGRWVEAITAHEKACKYDPSNKQFRINLSAARTAYGQQLLAKGSVSEACSLFRQAIVAAPDNSLAVRSLVSGLKKAGLDPSSAATRIKLGDQLKDASDFEGASIEYGAALQLEPSARSYIKMGDLAYSVGQVPQAANWYRQAIIKDPDCGAAHRQIGFLEMAAGDQTNAAASLRKALILDSTDNAAGTALVEIWRRQVAINPSSAEHHLGLATALQLTNDFTGAESEYRQVESIDPSNPGLALGKVSLAKAYAHAKAEKLKLAAQTLFSQGLKPNALTEIAEAVKLEPRNASYQFMYAECLEAVGNYRDAHQAYITCVLIDPQNNVEAASRAKKMEARGNATPEQVSQAADRARITIQAQDNQQVQSLPQLPESPQSPQGQQLPQSTESTGSQNEPNSSLSSKNMFEGGSGAQSLPNNQLFFRTHDEPSDNLPASGLLHSNQPEASLSPNNPFAKGPSSSTVATANFDTISKIAKLESQNDFSSAISILRAAIDQDMKNADLHHHLALDLQQSNELSEALSEFRLASALAPKNQDFSNDLNQAVAANKKSTESSTTNIGASINSNKQTISGLNDVTGASK
jgi:tetratricopeptide (TPR) repeat protein